MNNRLLALFLLLALKTFAQSGNFFETYNLNLNIHVIITDALDTKDGGYAVCGYSQGINGGDFFVIKTDSSGQIQWTFQNNEFDGGDFSNEAHKIIETEDSSLIIAGVNNGITGLDNLFYAKFDANGILKWKKGNPILQNIGVGSLNYENDSSIILIGRVGIGMYFIKLNSNGDTLKTKKVPYYNNLRYSLLKTVKLQNHYYLSGKIDTITSTPISYSRITKIDSVGNFIWTKTLIDTANSDYSDVRIFNDSLILHLAYYYGSPSYNKIKFLNKDGNLLSSIKINNSMSGIGAFVDDSNYVYSQLSLGDTLHACKTDFTAINSIKYKGSVCKPFNPIIIFKDKMNRIIFSGYMDTPNISDPNPNKIGFLMCFDTETNIGISPIKLITKIKVYPCPGTEFTSFSIAEDLFHEFKHFTIKIFDEQGKLVLLKENIVQSITTINTSKLNGLYTFEISSNNNSYSGKLILNN